MTQLKLFKRIESPYLKLLNVYKLSNVYNLSNVYKLSNVHKLSNVYKLSKEHESLKEYNLIFLGLNRSFSLRTEKKLRNLKARFTDPS
jgi:hypothetical protein